MRLATGDYGGASRDFGKALEIDPAYAMAYYHRAGSVFKAGYIEGALSDINRAVGLMPRYAPAYLLRGDILLGSNPREAIINYRAAKTLDPSNSRVYDARIKRAR